MVQLVTSEREGPRGPSPQAVCPRQRIHYIEISVGERHATPAPQTWPRRPLLQWGIPPTHLNLFSGCHLPRVMMSKCLKYKTRIWAMMLNNRCISSPNGS
jgi:hypothetical protein